MSLIKKMFSLRENTKEYNWGIDVIKLLAMFLVSLVHTTTISGWSSFELSLTLKNFLITFGRMLGFCCVPLYLITTGYLCRNKQLSFSYYLKIVKILLEYFVCTTIFYFLNIVITNNAFNLIQMLKFILNFTNFWYISMYIGLFIFIPFLNILYKNLRDMEQKVIFISFLILILSLPGTFFLFSFNYWLTGYPILFYYIGCFLAEYRCHIPKGCLVLALSLNLVISAFIPLLKLPINVEVYCSLFCVISSVLIFIMLKDFFIAKKNKWVQLIRCIANLTLSYYLLGGIFEQLIIHRVFVQFQLITFYQKIAFVSGVLPLMVLVTLMFAFVANLISNKLFKMIITLLNKYTNKRIL